MSIKLNSHNLPDKTIDLMKSILHKSKQTKTESGFTLCTDQKNDLQARNICTGEDCTIGIRVECGKQEKFAGTYHTHPISYSIASARDLIHCGAVPNMCIGGVRDNNIRCYTWKHEHITKEKYNKFIDMLGKGIRQIDDPINEKNFECMKEFEPIMHTEKTITEGDKKINVAFSLIQIAKQEKIPKFTIDEMEKAMKSKLDTRSKIASENNKSSAKLTPKYYKENILENMLDK